MNRPPLPAVFLERRAARLRRVQEEVNRSPALLEAIQSLAGWFATVRIPPYDAMPMDERLMSALADPSGNPGAWCEAAGRPLPAALLLGLPAPDARGPQSHEFGEIPAYALGRAAMRQALAAPGGSAGLSAAYGLVQRVGVEGLADLGADAELSEGSGPPADALAEVAAESARLGSRPEDVASGFDRGLIRAAIAAARSLPSLEACARHIERSVAIDLPFARVIQALGGRDPDFASRQLEAIANPAVVAEALGERSLMDATALARLLPALDPVFGAANRWTGRTAAWLVLLAIEGRTTALLRAAESRGEPTPDVHAAVQAAARALDGRPDGERLALEWLAHLAWQVAGSRASGSPDARRRSAPADRLFRSVIQCFSERAWSVPERAWLTFGGDPAATLPTGHRELSTASHLPLWLDAAGKATAIVPAVVAVRLCSKDAATNVRLVDWVGAVCARVEDDPALPDMSHCGTAGAAACLAWPLANAPDPCAAFGTIWDAADWLRIRARFARIEEAAGPVAAVAALLRVGLCTLGWASEAPGRDSAALAELLADCVDEARYAVRPAGVADWNELAGLLARGMAAAGLLDGDRLPRFLARYDGDDDALACACVQARAGGVGAEDIRRALLTVGQEPGGLAERWAQWNSDAARDAAGGGAAFLAELREIDPPPRLAR